MSHPPETSAHEYQIVSSALLPFRMKGRFTYKEAYEMCCDWNSWHLAQDRAVPEKVDDQAMPLEFV